jgi:hypothetical protein
MINDDYLHSKVNSADYVREIAKLRVYQNSFGDTHRFVCTYNTELTLI